MDNNPATGNHNGSARPMALFATPSQRRADLRTVRRAVLNRWPVEDDVRRVAVDVAKEFLTSPDPRDRKIGLQTLVDMVGQNINIDIAEDRAESPETQEGKTVIVIQPPPSPRGNLPPAPEDSTGGGA